MESAKSRAQLEQEEREKKALRAKQAGKPVTNGHKTAKEFETDSEHESDSDNDFFGLRPNKKSVKSTLTRTFGTARAQESFYDRRPASLTLSPIAPHSSTLHFFDENFDKDYGRVINVKTASVQGLDEVLSRGVNDDNSPRIVRLSDPIDVDINVDVVPEKKEKPGEKKQIPAITIQIVKKLTARLNVVPNTYVLVHKNRLTGEEESKIKTAIVLHHYKKYATEKNLLLAEAPGFTFECIAVTNHAEILGTLTQNGCRLINVTDTNTWVLTWTNKAGVSEHIALDAVNGLKALLVKDDGSYITHEALTAHDKNSKDKLKVKIEEAISHHWATTYNRSVYYGTMVLASGGLALEALYEKFNYNYTELAAEAFIKEFAGMFGQADNLNVEILSKLAIAPAAVITALDGLCNITLFDAYNESVGAAKKLPDGFARGTMDYLKKGFGSVGGFFTVAIPTLSMAISFPIGAYADVEAIKDWLAENMGAWEVLPIGIAIALGSTYYLLAEGTKVQPNIDYYLSRGQEQMHPPQASLAQMLLNKKDNGNAARAIQCSTEMILGLALRCTQFGFLCYRAAHQFNFPRLEVPAAIAGVVSTLGVAGVTRTRATREKWNGKKDNRLDLPTLEQREQAYEAKWEVLPWPELVWSEFIRLLSPTGLSEAALAALWARHLPSLLPVISGLEGWPIELALPAFSAFLGSIIPYVTYLKADRTRELSQLVVDAKKHLFNEIADHFEYRNDPPKANVVVMPNPRPYFQELVDALEFHQLLHPKCKLTDPDSVKAAAASIEQAVEVAIFNEDALGDATDLSMIGAKFLEANLKQALVDVIAKQPISKRSGVVPAMLAYCMACAQGSEQGKKNAFGEDGYGIPIAAAIFSGGSWCGRGMANVIFIPKVLDVLGIKLPALDLFASVALASVPTSINGFDTFYEWNKGGLAAWQDRGSRFKTWVGSFFNQPAADQPVIPDPNDAILNLSKGKGKEKHCCSWLFSSTSASRRTKSRRTGENAHLFTDSERESGSEQGEDLLVVDLSKSESDSEGTKLRKALAK